MQELALNGGSPRPVIHFVDDEPMLLELAEAVLKPAGYEVRTFRDPAEALGSFKAASIPPDLLVVDYAMHGMTGLELLAACRNVRPSQKVLLISGTVGPEILRSSPVKPDRFLAKPFDAVELLENVSATLGRKRLPVS